MAQRDYDREILSDGDYDRLQQIRQDWQNAADESGRRAANERAEQLRARYGYSRGQDGAGFTILDPMPDVSADTNVQMLHWRNADPSRDSQWAAAWERLYGQYVDRDPFSYDLAADPLYQQYRQEYTDLGSRAMRDTLGQAAALTGGYDSTYAQSAGQQAYNDYLGKLWQVVPDLYDRAYGRYRDEGERLKDAASLAADRYSREMEDYWNAAGYWTGRADREQDRADAQRELDYQHGRDAYSDSRDRYASLVEAISAAGYNPTDAELAAAGMSRAEADSWRNYYLLQLAGMTGGAGSSGSSGGSSSRRSSSGRSTSRRKSTSKTTSKSTGKSTNTAAQSNGALGLAQAFLAAHGGDTRKYLDGPAVQGYMKSNNITGPDERTAFLDALRRSGWDYSWR